MLHQANQPPPEPPAPIRRTVSRPKSAPAPKSRRPPTPQSESESESEFSDSGSSESSYEDVDTIYKHVVEDKKCSYVSPAGLRDKKTSKDAIAHLKTKNCPEVPALKKKKPARAPTPPPAPTKAEAPEAPKAKKSKKVAVAPEAAPAPPAETAPAAKAKRAPSAYNTFVAEQRKAGKSMAEAAAAWKAKKGESA